VVAELAWRAAPDDEAGPLTIRRAAVVSAPALAAWAARLDVGPWLRLGRGEEQAGGRTKESVLAEGLEAVVGALYLDGGLEPVRRLIAGLLPASPAPW
jgi:ribonuclease-3